MENSISKVFEDIDIFPEEREDRRQVSPILNRTTLETPLRVIFSFKTEELELDYEIRSEDNLGTN